MYSYFEDGKPGCELLPFYTNIKEQLQNYQNYDLPKFSEKILQALCFIYNEKKNRQNNFNEEYCSYLYYWLGHKIYPLVHDKTIFTNIIKMIYDELYAGITENFIVCRYVYTPIDEDIFNKNKVLFDYSKDYHNFELATPHGETTCDKDYKEYMNNYIRMYNEAYFDCNKGNKNNFDCNYFSKLFQEKQYNSLSSFSCIQSDKGGVFLDKHKAHEKQEPPSVQSYRQTTVTPPSPQHVPGRIADLGMKQQLGNHKFPRTIETIQLDDTTEGGSSKTIAGSVAPVLGVSSISLLLYKVTPLGGFIRNFLGRNRNMYNPAEYMDSFNPYSDGMVPGDRRMNISYHRL
ncbi:PIR protein [Plasmodium vivax]|uniref:VIR protein n=1 Tax=Plasmodium vivax TaxID=5855 RepID=A0A565A4P3_PLAVI|nr:PIR protein [Plasmodium vivax]